MLPRANRLTLKIDFKKVLKNKSYIHSQYFTAASLKEDSNQNIRIGIIVANKVSKRATERNRIKRVIRETAHKLLNTLPQNLSVVVLTKPTSVEVENKILAKDAEVIFKKLK
jgi:ribonuclease P protein component